MQLTCVVLTPQQKESICYHVKSIAFFLLFFLKGLEQKLTEALHSILNDDKQGERVVLYGTTVTYSSLRWVAKLVKYHHDNPSSAHSSEHDQLFYLVYERVQVVEESLDPHLWAYRSRITLEHLRQNLQQQNMKKKCPILHAFLQKVCVCVCVGGGGGGGGDACVHMCAFPRLPLDHFQTPAWLTSSVNISGYVPLLINSTCSLVCPYPPAGNQLEGYTVPARHYTTAAVSL